ncbi:hypothetical protein ALC56_09559, partial [Trachymyrmex septentrionalis]
EKNIVTEKTNQRENKATDEEKKDLSKFDSSTDRDKANIASDKHFWETRRQKRNSISFATLKSGEKNIVTEKTNQRENKATDEEKKDLSKFDSSTDRDKANIASDKHFWETRRQKRLSTTHPLQSPYGYEWSEPIKSSSSIGRFNQNTPFNYPIIPSLHFSTNQSAPFFQTV